MVQKGWITTRILPPPPNPLPPGFRSDLHCAFHEGAAGHDLENCYPLKARVQELVRDKILSFHDTNPNVLSNPLPEHKKGSFNQLQPSYFPKTDISSLCLISH